MVKKKPNVTTPNKRTRARRSGAVKLKTRSPRNKGPLTQNVHAVAFSGFDEKLNIVLSRYFDDEHHSRIFRQIYQAVSAYNLQLQERTIAKNQRRDRKKLIACMKELSEQLHPASLPKPLLDAASSIVPYLLLPRANDSAVRDILLRLLELQRLFERTEIPDPIGTNPGKPERRLLIDRLSRIFNASTRGSYQGQSIEKRRDRDHFIRQVLQVFHIKSPR